MHRHELLDAAQSGAQSDSWIETWDELVATGVPAVCIDTPSAGAWSSGLRVMGTHVLLMSDGTWLREGPHDNSVGHDSVANLLSYRHGPQGASLKGHIRQSEAERAGAIARTLGDTDAEAPSRGWSPVGKEPIACGLLGEAIIVRTRGQGWALHGRAWSHFVEDEPAGLLTPWTLLHAWPSTGHTEIDRETYDTACRAARRMAGRPGDRLVPLADLPGHMGFEDGTAPSVDTLRRAVNRAEEDGPPGLDASHGGDMLYHPVLARAWWDHRPGHGPGRPRKTTR